MIQAFESYEVGEPIASGLHGAASTSQNIWTAGKPSMPETKRAGAADMDYRVWTPLINVSIR